MQLKQLTIAKPFHICIVRFYQISYQN